MVKTARQYADALDLILGDHFPTCPRCGNLCGRLARVCVDCGCRLYELPTQPTDLSTDEHRDTLAG